MQPILVNSKQFSTLEDAKIHRSIEKHKNFPNFKPLSPLSNSLKQVKPKIIFIVTVPKANRLLFVQKVSVNKVSNEGTKNHFELRKIKSCNVHLTNGPLKFCIDCFFTNFFDSDLQKNSELRDFVNKFKNSCFNKTEGIRNDFEPKKIKSCILHLTDRPSKFCIDCSLTNYIGSEFDQDSEFKDSAVQFKNSPFPSFDDRIFDFS